MSYHRRWDFRRITAGIHVYRQGNMTRRVQRLVVQPYLFWWSE